MGLTCKKLQEIERFYTVRRFMICTSYERVKCTEHVTCMWEKIGKPWALVGKPEGNEPLGRIRRRKKDDTQKDI